MITRDGGWFALPAVLLLLAACSTASAPAPAASPTASWRWNGLIAKCPVLDGAAAHTFGVSGEGRPTADYRVKLSKGLFAVCVWGRPDGTVPGVEAKIDITHPKAVDAVWNIWEVYDQVPGLGDDARRQVTLRPSGLAIHVRSDNALVTVTITPSEPSGETESEMSARLKRLEPVATEITKDVLEDLR